MPVFVNVYGAQESLPPAYDAVWRAGTTNRAVVVVLARQAGNRFLGSSKGLQIRTQVPQRVGKGICERCAGPGSHGLRFFLLALRGMLAFVEYFKGMQA